MGNNNNKRKQNNKNSNKKYTSKSSKANNNDLVFDDERLEKTELLDISFLEETSEIEVLDVDETRKKEAFNFKSGLLPTSLFVLCAFVLGFAVSLVFSGKILSEDEVKVQTIEKIKISNDDNYVFLGDSIFEMYDLEKYYDGLPVVNSGISGNTTEDVLNNLNDRVYRYNPSKVFILIGTNDIFLDDYSIEGTVNNIKEIVDDIKENRPFAEIYIQSVYPVSKSDDDKISEAAVFTRNNKDIKEINKGIEKLCKEKKVTYIDMYSLLVDEEDNLNLDYTTEGLHISAEGYEVITKEIMKYIK